MRRALKTASALLLLCAFAALAAGCAWLGDLLYDAKEAGEDASATEPAETDGSAPAPKNDGANPVFTFCMGFLSVYRRVGSGMLSEVLSSGDEALMRYYMLLSDDMALLDECLATVGMLPAGTDTPAPFSGTLEGAYSGSGEIDRHGRFTFECSGGARITGSIEDGLLLSFRRVSHGKAAEAVISRSGRGYTARIAEGSSVRFIELTRDGLRYTETEDASGKSASGEPFFPESGGTPVFSYSNGAAVISE